MLQKKAQGTIEYLVIIAIVVVIALVVVGLLLQVLGQGSGIPESTARTAWKSASPFAVTDWSKSADGNIQIVLKNDSYEALDFSGIVIGSVNTWATTGGFGTVDINNIAPGATQTITVLTGTCSPGAKYSYPKEGISISYRTPSITSDRTENAAADLIGTCSS